MEQCRFIRLEGLRKSDERLSHAPPKYTVAEARNQAILLVLDSQFLRKVRPTLLCIPTLK